MMLVVPNLLVTLRIIICPMGGAQHVR